MVVDDPPDSNLLSVCVFFLTVDLALCLFLTAVAGRAKTTQPGSSTSGSLNPNSNSSSNVNPSVNLDRSFFDRVVPLGGERRRAHQDLISTGAGRRGGPTTLSLEQKNTGGVRPPSASAAVSLASATGLLASPESAAAAAPTAAAAPAAATPAARAMASTAAGGAGIGSTAATARKTSDEANKPKIIVRNVTPVAAANAAAIAGRKEAADGSSGDAGEGRGKVCAVGGEGAAGGGIASREGAESEASGDGAPVVVEEEERRDGSVEFRVR